MKTLNTIQMLRGMAALMVVSTHAIGGVAGMAKDGLGNKSILSEIGHFDLFGHGGVDLFFVISGFIITLISTNEKNYSTSGASFFMIRRFLRVVPLYWFYAVIFLVQIIYIHHYPLKWDYFIYSFLLIPSPNPWGQSGHFLIVAWTLTFEMFFYVVVAFGLLTARRRFWLVTIAILVAMSATSPWVRGWEPNGIGYLFQPILLEFVFGMTIGYLLLHGRTARRSIALLCVVVGLIGLIGVIYWGRGPASLGAFGRPLVVGLPAAFLLYGLVSLESGIGSLIPKPLRLLGDASYTLYLVHIPVLSFLRYATPKVATVITGSALVAFMICLCVAIAIPLYLVVERPFIAAQHRWMARLEAWWKRLPASPIDGVGRVGDLRAEAVASPVSQPRPHSSRAD